MKRKPALTELGKAIRERDAYDASAWEFDYSEAIKAAFAGDASRLLNLLRGHKRPVTANALTDDDLDQLADLIEALAKRKRGRERNRAVHEAARLADVIMHMGKPAKEIAQRRFGHDGLASAASSTPALHCGSNFPSALETESRCAIY